MKLKAISEGVVEITLASLLFAIIKEYQSLLK
jgi:hypothetical protein